MCPSESVTRQWLPVRATPHRTGVAGSATGHNDRPSAATLGCNLPTAVLTTTYNFFRMEFTLWRFGTCGIIAIYAGVAIRVNGRE